tara:strand:+ start:287 stop:577 length:291 start_codon:yes stop_codon:yes gene_type:complete
MKITVKGKSNTYIIDKKGTVKQLNKDLKYISSIKNSDNYKIKINEVRMIKKTINKCFDNKEIVFASELKANIIKALKGVTSKKENVKLGRRYKIIK